MHQIAGLGIHNSTACLHPLSKVLQKDDNISTVPINRIYMDTQMFLIILMEQKELSRCKYVHKNGYIMHCSILH